MSLRRSALCAAVFALIGFGRAQAQTPTVWNFGTLPEAFYTSKTHFLNCSAEGPQGTSSIAFGSSGTDALMGMQISYQYNNSKNNTYRSTYFNGIARLLFTSSTAGTVAYDSVGALKMKAPALQFSGYTATYDQAAGTLSVAMTIALTTEFPCTLAVNALYRMP